MYMFLLLPFVTNVQLTAMLAGKDTDLDTILRRIFQSFIYIFSRQEWEIDLNSGGLKVQRL